MSIYRFNPSTEGRRKERDKGYITVHKSRNDKPSRHEKVLQFKSNDSTMDVSPRALMELSNPDTIYLLGGRPTYIHSKQAYFDAGLVTANQQLNTMLLSLVQEQKSKIKLYAHQINQRWYDMVKDMHIDINNKLNFDNAFDIFKDFYDKVIMSGSDMNEYHAKMLLIQKLRTAVDLTGDLNRLRLDAQKQPQDAEHTIIDIIKGQLDILGLNIKADDLELELFSTGRVKNFKNTAALLEKIKKQIMVNYRQACKQVAVTYGKELKSHARELVKILGDELTKDVEAQGNRPLNKTWDVAFDTLKRRIGDLFELMMRTAINQAFIISTQNTEWKDIFSDIVIEDALSAYDKIIEDSNKSKEEKLTTKEAKIDTTLKLTIKNNAFNIPISDKTGQSLTASDIVNHDSQSKNYLKVQEHFSARIRLQGQNYEGGLFGDQSVSSQSFTENQAHFEQLLNYVLYNEYYLGTSVPAAIKEFNATVLSYIGWLRLVISIIGVPEKAGEQTPMAVRTPRTIYNTAAILSSFLPLGPKDMIHSLGSGYNQMFVKHMATLEDLLEKTKDPEKIQSIRESMPGNKVAFEAFKASKSIIISENGGPSDALTYSHLYSLFASELSKLTQTPIIPLFTTYFNINLGNLSAIV